MIVSVRDRSLFVYVRTAWVGSCVLAWLLGAVPAECAEPLVYNRDIRPVLSDNCFACHGPDQSHQEGGLRLDVRDVAIQPADSGEIAIVPGTPDQSEMIARILSDDPDIQMPPPTTGHQLTADQRNLIRRWITEGAVYQKHWAFEPIHKASASGNAIDFFIRQAVMKAGLQPSPPAAAETQLRRVSLDLTGLPPTIDETDTFLADLHSRGIDAAYETVVDRLLASPRYGERMAWQWLEAARYADTDGYQNDGPRDMWRWRDWVIDAYNSNMPFDRFTIEQLAGDLLPDPTQDQLIATAFNRNNRYNSEEGIPIDEFLLENAVDRVDTTSTVWMGLTIGCARCHDHKFDPLSQKEYYQLIDYFNDVAESGRAVKFGNSEPWIRTPTKTQQQELGTFADKVKVARDALDQAEANVSLAQQNWEREWKLENPVLQHGLDHYYAFDVPEDRVVAQQQGASLQPGMHGDAVTVDDEGYFEVEKIPGLIGNGRFSIAFWIMPDRVDTGPVLSNEADGTGRNGILVEFVNGRLRWNINTRWISGVSTIETQRTFSTGQWVHVTLTNDGTQRADGMKLYVDGVEQPVNVIRNTNSNTAGRDQGTAMRIGYSKHVGYWQGQVDELRFYTKRTLSSDEAALLAVRDTPDAIAAIPEPDRTPQQRELLRLAFLEQGADPDLKGLLTTWQQAEEAHVAFEDKLPTTMIMRDLPEGRSSFVRLRGVYDALGDPVDPGVPGVFPPLPSDATNDRLAFARWLVSPQHPLTARVAVNRYWQLLFGRGFVNTAEDFGAQGEPPSHPELLDWLAAELIESGWNIKSLMKRIVMSDTYRQSSAMSEDHRRIDTDNVLLSHAPRTRLPGNVLRDQALMVSGLLVEEQGGPSVFPYQPEGLWEEASNAKYKVGKGEDLYRRSLYTYWKRTLAPPSMAVLDTGDREYCTVRPKRTNTPLQALTLMNETTFVEAARKLGERMLTEAGETDSTRIAFGFRTVTTRMPTSVELQLLTTALNDFRSDFKANPEAAAASQNIGNSPPNKTLPPIELAAATALANVLLNLDEVTARE